MRRCSKSTPTRRGHRQVHPQCTRHRLRRQTTRRMICRRLQKLAGIHLCQRARSVATRDWICVATDTLRGRTLFGRSSTSISWRSSFKRITRKKMICARLKLHAAKFQEEANHSRQNVLLDKVQWTLASGSHGGRDMERMWSSHFSVEGATAMDGCAKMRSHERRMQQRAPGAFAKLGFQRIKAIRHQSRFRGKIKG